LTLNAAIQIHVGKQKQNLLIKNILLKKYLNKLWMKVKQLHISGFLNFLKIEIVIILKKSNLMMN
jgi:hypothetical protein